jgi:hypothetical protein
VGLSFPACAAFDGVLAAPGPPDFENLHCPILAGGISDVLELKLIAQVRLGNIRSVGHLRGVGERADQAGRGGRSEGYACDG